MQFDEQHFRKKKINAATKSPRKTIHLVPVLPDELDPAKRIKPVVLSTKIGKRLDLHGELVQEALGTTDTNDIFASLFENSLHEIALDEMVARDEDAGAKDCINEIIENLISQSVDKENCCREAIDGILESQNLTRLPEINNSYIVTRTRKAPKMDKALKEICNKTTENADDWDCDDEDLLSSVGVDVLNEYRSGVISVSDISRQTWCEQQLLYTFIYPFIEDEEGNIIRVDDKAHINAGTDLHETRELEVHVKRSVKCETREDSYGIRLLNMLTSFEHLYSCMCRTKKGIVREVVIFGEPYELGLYFRGIIDEINYDPEHKSLGVVEFKTRRHTSLPSSSQCYAHSVQVNLYRKLLNDLISGVYSKAMYFKKFKLDANIRFSEDVQKEFGSIATNLNEIFEVVMKVVQKLPPVKRGWVEYMSQESKKIFKSTTVTYNDDHLKAILVNASGFWLGTRPCYGVDIEETWKCKMCAYAECCEWRLRKAKEISKKRKLS